MSQKFKITGISVDERNNRHSINLGDGRTVHGKEFFRDIEVTVKQGFNQYGWPAAVEDKVFYNEGATEERRLNRMRRNGWLG